MEMAGDEPKLPPVTNSWFIIETLQKIGFVENTGMGRVPVNPTTLMAWASGTATVLLPKDFEDVLYLSRVYCAACSDYDGTQVQSPYEPELTDEEQAAHDARVKAKMDAVMGL
jgi:hypothetical protein